MKIFLASKSPRRQELLKKLGVPFTVVSLEVSEIPDKNINVQEQILDIARRKAEAAIELLKNREKGPFLVISADTEVIHANQLMGKPEDEQKAIETLVQLSGQWHHVTTALVIITYPDNILLTHIETTKIKFKDLSLNTIKTYVATGEPMDKAGSYGIQGLGRNLVEVIQGDFENVVGLPVNALAQLLADLDLGPEKK
ncbi:MAG: Maf family protein [Bdellovibrionia bacterium]